MLSCGWQCETIVRQLLSGIGFIVLTLLGAYPAFAQKDIYSADYNRMTIQSDSSARFYFRDTFRFFMTCISDGSLVRGRHGGGGLSIYPRPPPLQLANARMRAAVGTSLEPKAAQL